jgi:hypothetical protein
VASVCTPHVRSAPVAASPHAEYISGVNHHEGLYAQLSGALADYERRRASQVLLSLRRRKRVQGLRARHAQQTCVARSVSVRSHCKRRTPLCSLQPGRQPEGWCSETVLVARRLRLDMEQGGVHLPPQQRAALGRLASANGHFATAFNAALVRHRGARAPRNGLSRPCPA